MADNNEEPVTVENFGNWLSRFEHDQDTQNKQIGKLTDMVTSLATTVGGLVSAVQSVTDNQKGIFHRQNRPPQWGAIIGALTMIVVFAGLLIAPMKRQDELIMLALTRVIDRVEYLDERVNYKLFTHLEDDAYNTGKHDTQIEWLAKMEDRLDRKIHGEPVVP